MIIKIVLNLLGILLCVALAFYAKAQGIDPISTLIVVVLAGVASGLFRVADEAGRD